MSLETQRQAIPPPAEPGGFLALFSVKGPKQLGPASRDKIIDYYVASSAVANDPFKPLPAHVEKYRTVRTPPVIMLWICCGGEWTPAGSYAAGRCLRCGKARPD